MARQENFYRRDPGKALQGMASMSLEERGVYNTVIDLLYLTWRPLENDRGYIAGHCRCAVQKLNPILNRLIAAGKLICFEEGGQEYISNPKFELERTSVKGVTTSSGRREVGEKSASVSEKSGEVGEKSEGVEENPPLPDNDVEEIQGAKPLEKSREEKSRELADEKPSAGLSDPAATAWALVNLLLTERTGANEKQARSFFGGLLAKHKLEAREMLPALAAAQVNETRDPRSYLVKAAEALAKRRDDRTEAAKPKRVSFV
jgi:hypothetical protein